MTDARKVPMPEWTVAYFGDKAGRLFMQGDGIGLEWRGNVVIVPDFAELHRRAAAPPAREWSDADCFAAIEPILGDKVTDVELDIFRAGLAAGAAPAAAAPAAEKCKHGSAWDKPCDFCYEEALRGRKPQKVTIRPPTAEPPTLYTIRFYPCGCCGRGYGDIPAHCPVIDHNDASFIGASMKPEAMSAPASEPRKSHDSGGPHTFGKLTKPAAEPAPLCDCSHIRSGGVHDKWCASIGGSAAEPQRGPPYEHECQRTLSEQGKPYPWGKCAICQSGPCKRDYPHLYAKPAAEPAPDEYMCPNCVTPWKCNGPHIDRTLLREDQEREDAK